MSGRKLSKEYALLAVPDLTSDTLFTSPTIDVSIYDNIGLQCIWTGANTGAITVQGSLDGVNFTPLSVEDEAGNPPVMTGAAGSLLIRITEVPYPNLNVTVDSDGMTAGTISILASAKMI